MDDLLEKLEALKIKNDFCEDTTWSLCIDLIQRSFVPQKMIGMERPCEEEDFREYRLIVDKNLHNISFLLQHIMDKHREKHVQLCNITEMARIFGMNLLLLIGEQNERNIWNTIECVSISKELISGFCILFTCESISQFLSNHKNLSDLLLMLRPKLLKDTWKTYPSAVACYKWILLEAEKPILFDHIEDIVPTALIILDDYFPDNIVIGLECIYQIIQHSCMKKEFMDSGYAKVIYHALEILSHQKEARYIIPLYSCMASLLATIEHWDNTINMYEWTIRDDVFAILIENMQFEQNIELRHAYISSLSQLITNISCSKWCESLARIIADYCGNHTDLRTLKISLETAKKFLTIFRARVAAHSTTFYTSLLKLHFDLTRTPVFDRTIMQNLEDCISMLYQASPKMGHAVMSDIRMSPELDNLSAIYQDFKYFE